MRATRLNLITQKQMCTLLINVVSKLLANVANKVRSKMDNMMESVKTRVQDAVLSAMKNLVFPRVELAPKSANSPSERSVDDNVLAPKERDFQVMSKVYE